MAGSKYLLAVMFFLLCGSLRAQENEKMDYMKHNKVFFLCSFKRQCSNCNDCNNQRYLVKIKNRLDKPVTSVRYVYYSAVYNRIVTKEAKLEGGLIDPKNTGMLYICIPDGRHWAISEIEYKDGSTNSFVVKDRLDRFDMEPDECECNPTTYYHSIKDLQ